MKKQEEKIINDLGNALSAEQKVNSDDTLASNDTAYKLKDSLVSIPAERGIEEAKEWVDDESRL